MPSLSSALSRQELLDRAFAAEAEAARWRRRADDLEERLGYLVGTEPDDALRATTWITRAELAESLLAELWQWIVENPSVRDLLPTGFPERVNSQLKSLLILKRDQGSLGEVAGDDRELFERIDGGAVVRVAGLNGKPMASMSSNGDSVDFSWRVTMT
jgi:hypothetical protein